MIFSIGMLGDLCPGFGWRGFNEIRKRFFVAGWGMGTDGNVDVTIFCARMLFGREISTNVGWPVAWRQSHPSHTRPSYLHW